MRKKSRHIVKSEKLNKWKIISIIFSILLIPLVFWASQYPQLITSRGQDIIKPFDATISQSKLGIFYLGTTPDGNKMMQAGPKVIKVIDPQSNGAMMQLVRDYKSRFPQGKVVMRVYEGTPGLKYGLNDNPENSAVDFFQKVLQPAINKMSENDRKLIDYLSGTNGNEQTPVLGTSETGNDSVWFGKFQARLAELTYNAGFKPSIGELYVGGPDPQHLEGFEVALRKIKDYGGVWSVHGYTLDYTTDINTEKYTSLRYRDLNNWLQDHYPDVANLPMILGEGGVDKEGNPNNDGWQPRGPAQKYEEWLTWYDQELQKDPYIIAVTLFQSGGNSWPSFEINPISNWMVNYLSNQPNTTLAPTSNITDIPSASPTINPSITQTSTLASPTPAFLISSPTISPLCNLTPPTNLSVTWDSLTKATIKWTAGTGGSLQKLLIGTGSYEVENGCPNNLGVPCVVKESNIPASQTSYTSSDVFTSGKSYFFRVINYKDESCWKDKIIFSIPVTPIPTNTLTPTPSPTFTPTPSPTLTITPTPSLVPTVTITPAPNPIIRFKAKLASLQTYPDLFLKLRIKDDLAVALSHAGSVIPFSSQSICDNPPSGIKDYYIPVHADENGVYTPVSSNTVSRPTGVTIPSISDDGWITLPDQTSGKKYTLVLKAPKTKNRITAEHILLTSGKQPQEFDWTSTPLEPGDLPNPANGNKQDCVINSLDISLVIARLGKTDKENLDIADVNYDGIINGNDLSKIILSIASRDEDI